MDHDRERSPAVGQSQSGSIGEGAAGRRTRVAARYPNLARAMPAAADGDAAPSIHDAATVAVDHKGGGASLDAGVGAKVGAHLGADFSGVRVHQDPLTQEATAAMGARAFAYGSDVFLGAGESGSDLGLMAHELTHVAQQGAAGQRAPQGATKHHDHAYPAAAPAPGARQVQVGDANSPAEAEADKVAADVVGGKSRPGGQLIVDEGPVQPGQMLKSAFFATLREQVVAAAAEELGPAAPMGCPYIDLYFGRYATQSAAAGEAMLRRFAPGVAAVTDAAAMIPLVVHRVRDGVRSYNSSGAAPSDLAGADPAIPAMIAAGETQAAALRAPDGRETLASLEADLGPGAALDGATASRMSGALGADVSGARIHTGATAARKADEAGALAFAVGPHVVMGAAAPSAGTVDGDALLAHELTHTVQQAGADTSGAARRAPIGAESSAAEAGADRAADAALVNLHGGGAHAFRIEGASDALTMQRCGGPRTSGSVRGNAADGRYGWSFGYEVNLTGTEALTVIKVKLTPDANVTADQVLDVKTRARTAYRNIWDDKFILTDTADNKQYALRCDVQFVTSGEHYEVALHVGPDGTANRTNWYTGNYDETLAHELGHQLGLKDEYIDATVPDRATATSPGVHTDHSIMGDYGNEGRAQARAQLRHGQTMGNSIGGATGRTFTVARKP